MKRLRCAVYTRKSTEEGLDQDYNSLDAQRDACVAYITSQAGEGWTIVKTPYDDGGLSGATMERPALQRLLADIEARRIDIIVVYKVDRLTRSLSDFAKIVEVLDTHGVSFVSVTQQFNTTTSMGRLTLNVLLSFAQFEREVTAERIRDKIAASKKKGMWMGGVVPLGYDVVDRKLVVNVAEARTVQLLFDLYIRLGTVKEVKQEADRQGLRTKARRPNNGSRTGNVPFRVGHLHKLLTNRIYIGEITHKGKSYPAEHQPVIDRATWEAVQARLTKNTVKRRSGTNAASPSLLAGLLWDENGGRLKPSHATKAGQRYRYYISHGADDASAPSLASWRLPASALESLVLQNLCDFLGDKSRTTRTLELSHLSADGLKNVLEHASELRQQIENGALAERRALLLEIIDRVEVRQHLIRIVLRSNALRTDLAARDHRDSSVDELACIDIPVRLRRRGVELRFILEGESSKPCKPDVALAGAVVQAHCWFDAIRSGVGTSVSDLARQDSIHQADVSRILPLAFLAPDIVEAILDGRHPVELTAARLKRLRLPLSWADQRRILGFMA